MEESFTATFLGNTCDYFNKIKNMDRIGVEKMPCKDIYNGINEGTFGLSLTRHYNIMDSIRADLNGYWQNPTLEYMGDVPCFIPPVP